jgi:hypothetical protein
MRIVIIMLFFTFISCKPKTDKKVSNDLSVDTLSLKLNNETLSEKFDDFLEKFNSDTTFQIQRIDKPISVIISDEETEEEEMQEIKYVSFNQKDWDVKIQFNIIKVSKDTMNVILEGNDTGVHIEHLFAKRSDKWHLFQIKNLSD